MSRSTFNRPAAFLCPRHAGLLLRFHFLGEVPDPVQRLRVGDLRAENPIMRYLVVDRFAFSHTSRFPRWRGGQTGPIYPYDCELLICSLAGLVKVAPVWKPSWAGTTDQGLSMGKQAGHRRASDGIASCRAKRFRLHCPQFVIFCFHLDLSTARR
jgi:hypothetical protein